MHLQSLHASIFGLALTLAAGTAFGETATATAGATTPSATATAEPAPAAAAQPAPAAEPAPAPTAAPAPAPAAEPAPAPAAEPAATPGGPVPGSNPKYINLSLEQLEEKRDNVSLGGPIVMLAIGAPLVIIGGPWAVGSALDLAACSILDGNPYYSDVDISNCRTGATIRLVLSLGMVATGVPLGVIGGINLGKRIKERRSLSKEIDLRTKGEDYSLVVTPVYVPGGMGMGFQGTF